MIRQKFSICDFTDTLTVVLKFEMIGNYGLERIC